MTYLAESAFARSPASFGLDLSTEVIVLTPRSDVAEYQGTRAALEADGIIPSGVRWPNGFDDLRWADGQFHYSLRRVRPDGVKGPRRKFMEVDWWAFRCDPLHGKSVVERVIERKAKDLADYISGVSAKGQAESCKQYERYYEARNDERFHAFKALIPGIDRPNRPRRSKTAINATGDARGKQGEPPMAS